MIDLARTPNFLDLVISRQQYERYSRSMYYKQIYISIDIIFNIEFCIPLYQVNNIGVDNPVGKNYIN